MNMPGLYLEFSTNVVRIMQDVAQIRGGIGNATREINSMIATTKAALGSLGVGLSITGLVMFAKHTIDAIGNMKDLAQEVGTTASAISRFEAPARSAGLALSDVSNAIFRMSKAAIEAKDPSSRAAQALASIGLSAKDLKNLKPDEMFELVARRVSTYSEGLARNAVMQELFNKSGREMNKVVAEIAERAQLVATVTDEEAEAAKKFNDQLLELKMSSEKTWRSIASEGLPVLNQMLKAFIDAKREAGLLQGTIAALSTFFDHMAGTDSLEGQLKRIDKEIEKQIEVWNNLKKAREGFFGSFLQKDEWLADVDAKLKDLNQQRANILKLIAEANKAPPAASPPKSEPKFDPAAAAAAKKYAEELLALYNRLDNTTSGVNEKFWKELQMLHKEYEKGGMTIELYRARVEELTKQTDYGKTITQQQAEAAKYANKQVEEAIDLDERLRLAKEGLIRDMRLEAERIELETSLMGLSNAERAKAIALYNMQKSGVGLTAEQMEILANRIRDAAAAQESMRESMSIWSELGDRAGRFFTDILFEGKKVFTSLKDFVKDFAKELIALFVRKWILQLGASMTGNSALGTMAGQAGQGTLSGAASSMLGSGLSWAGNAAAGAMGYAGLGTMAEFFGAASGSIPAAAIGAEAVAAGVGTNTLAAGIGQAVAAIPVWGWIIAALAVIATLLSKDRGGPKYEGQFTGSYDASGNRIGPAGSSFNIVGTSGNDMASQWSDAVARGVADAIKAFGGPATAFQVGAGIVRDPAGKSDTFLDLILKTSEGRELLRMHNDRVGRSDEETKAEMELQSQRVILAALQHVFGDTSVLGKVFGQITDVAKASAEDIAKVMQQAQQYQQAFAQVTDMFSTDAERLAKLQEQVAAGFDALGVEMPKDAAGFKALVRKAWESGDKEMFDGLMQLAQAFKTVTDASEAAAEALMDQWSQVQDAIGTLTGQNTGANQLANLVSQFQSGNGWASGMAVQSVIEQLMTITQEDFANYSEENRNLIIAILQLAGSLKENTTAVVAQTQAISDPEGMGRSLIGDFDAQTSGLIGAEPTKMRQLSTSASLMVAQIMTWQQAMAGLSEYSETFQTLQHAIDGLRQRLLVTSADIAALTILEAQYGEAKGEQLFELQKWYDQQKALLAGNITALAALDQLYAEKRKGILEESIADVDRAKEALRDWWHGLFQDPQLSPLSLRQRFDLAKKDYDAALTLGDPAKLRDAAQLTLELGRQLFGSSTLYNALFAQIAQQTGTLAGISQTEINSRLYGALPTSSTLASSADIKSLETRIAELITVTLNGSQQVAAATTESGDKVASSVDASSNTGVLA